MKHSILYIIPIVFFLGCQSKKSSDPELNHLAGLLIGTFSSAEQSEKEVGFANFTLINRPIWKDSTGHWIYSEIHSTERPYSVYFQRILNIKRIDSVTLMSVGYGILNRERFINGWENPIIFNDLTLDSLKLRVGCDVYFRKKASSIYAGKTNNSSCKSSFKKIEYMTSQIIVSKDLISIWDRGYDTRDVQVFGKIQKPYKYKRIQQ